MSDADPSRAPFVFLFGLALFCVSLVAFVADLVTGHDVFRSLAGNAVGTLVLVWWAGYDTLNDPDSRVSTRTGAAGTALLLFGLYLVAAAVVVGATSLLHGRLAPALWGGGAGVALVLVGFLVFPREGIIDDAERDETNARGVDSATVDAGGEPADHSDRPTASGDEPADVGGKSAERGVGASEQTGDREP